ncbi:hypothetical protein [Roseobacter sp.]|uniref:hypothetical protein n=1 Tax=Roseobacter sp. TaxID=1907202 RepID=UPI003858F7C1
MIAPKPLCAVALIAVPGMLYAQTTQNLSEMTEMPAHRTFVTHSADAELAPFTTDGCSGGMSDVWAVTAAQFPQWAESQGEVPPWQECCVTHDRAYHNAGGKKEATQSFKARLKADEDLRSCVLAQGARDRETLVIAYGISEDTLDFFYGGIAQGMYFAVRLGGVPCSGLPWRWGYGFPNCSVLHRAWNGGENDKQGTE